MTWTQFARLWNDYGAFVTICIVVATALVTGIVLLVKFWPVITQVVTIGTALADLPVDMAELKLDISTLKTGQAEGHKSFEEHLVDSKTKTELLNSVDDRLDRIEAKAGVAAHQTTNNGGGSMKDAVDRSEARLKRVESALSVIAEKLGHSGEVPLTASGSITLTPDGAPTP
jgi:hypothetical protein